MLNNVVTKGLFYIEFPKKFVPNEIEMNYNSYINRMPKLNHHNERTMSCIDLIRSTIQGINFPSKGYDAVTTIYKDQYGMGGITRNDRASVHPQELISDKSINITLKNINGYINYFILTDILEHYYAYQTSEPYIFDIAVHILDNDGNVMLSRIYEDCIYTEISEIELSYSDNVATYESFNITLKYSQSHTKFLV